MKLQPSQIHQALKPLSSDTRGFMRSSKSLIKNLLRLLPGNISKQLLISRSFRLNYKYDQDRFLKWSSSWQQNLSAVQLKALITMDYHRIEKGLSLKEPKVGFGSDVVERLVKNLKTFQQAYGYDEVISFSLNALSEYHQFNKINGLYNQKLHEEILALGGDNEYEESCAGTLKVSKKEILKACLIDLENFFQARYSIRQFSDEDVNISLVEKAVKMAQKTPSVCNRQSSKVYIFSDSEDKKRSLSYQNGNRGFGHQASKVLVVTSNLEHFTKIGERNQCWIDGGMFAMSLVYALHSLGLGTCCLNWSVEYHTDKAFRQSVDIQDSEAVIMLIAVGHLPEEFKVAQSPRKQIQEVLVIK